MRRFSSRWEFIYVLGSFILWGRRLNSSLCVQTGHNLIDILIRFQQLSDFRARVHSQLRTKRGELDGPTQDGHWLLGWSIIFICSIKQQLRYICGVGGNLTSLFTVQSVFGFFFGFFNHKIVDLCSVSTHYIILTSSLSVPDWLDA